jgi:hypothetical protein
MGSNSRENLDVRVRLLEAKLAAQQAKMVATEVKGIGRASEEASVETSRWAKTQEGAALAGGKLRDSLKFLAGATGIGGVVFGVHEAIQSGQEWQQEQAQLEQALKNSHLRIGTSMKVLNETVDRSALHGGFSPQEETQGLAAFVRLTGSVTKAQHEQALAVDFARGRHIALASAVQAVSQAYTGNVGRLQRYIGNIQPVTYYVDSLTAAQKAQNSTVLKNAQALDQQATRVKANAAIQAKFGGDAAASAKTAAGGLSDAEHASQLLAEKIGQALLPQVTKAALWLTKVAEAVRNDWPQISQVAGQVWGDVKSVLDPVLDDTKSMVVWFYKHRDATITLGAAVATYVIGMKVAGTVTKTWSILMGILTVATGGTTEAFVGFNTVLYSNPIGLVVIAIAALVAGIVYAYLHCKTFRTVVNAVFEWLKGAIVTVVGFVRKHWGLLLSVIAAPLAPLILILKHLDLIKHAVKDIVGFGGKVAGTVGHLVGSVVPHLATGGIVPGVGTGDSQPIMATPGEGVLRREVVQAMGPARFNALNAGQGIGAGGDITIVPGTAVFMLDGRQIAEANMTYTLKMGAR